jgi:hypothetical protein
MEADRGRGDSIFVLIVQKRKTTSSHILEVAKWHLTYVRVDCGR